MKNPAYKLFFGILSFPLFLLSFLVPRSRDIWVFGAWYGNQYTDNTSYLYEYVKETKPEIKAIWLTRNKHVIQNLRNKGDNVFCKNSIYGLWYGSRAGITFINCGYDDVNKYCINRSIIVQLWHGVPLKKIKNDDMINENIQRPSLLTLIRIISIKLLPFLNERYDFIISSGTKVTDRFESAFKIDRSKIIETGYPRMDIILSEKSAYIKSQIHRHYNNTLEKNILFAPTHRGEGKGDSDMFSQLDFEAFNRFLQKHKSVMLIKMHYYELDNTSANSIKEYSHIQLLNNQGTNDINRILHHIDILITDYSSVFYDFLVLDRPIIFAPFDLDEYQKIDRELYEDYSSATPGPICRNWDEIQIQLKEYLSNGDIYQTEREQIFNQYFKYSDIHNSERIVDTVTNYLNTYS